MTSMKHLFLTLTTLILGVVVAYSQNNIPIYHSEEVEMSNRYIDGNAFQKDLLLYVHMLTKTHPYYADDKHRATLERRAKKIYNECCKITDTTTFKAYLAKLATTLNDGHTSISYLNSFENVFPIMLSIDMCKPTIINTCTEEYKDILGKEVKKINGKSINYILKLSKSLISADNDINFNNSVKEYLVFTQFWSLLGMSDKELKLTLADGEIVTIPATNRSSFLKNIVQLQSDISDRVTTEREVLFDYSIYEEQSICYLQFNQFADRITHPKQTQLARFDDFIHDMMDKMCKKGIQTLVIDLQYNSGGNSSLGDILLSWLYPHKDTKRYGVDIRISELLCHFHPYYKNFTIENKLIEIGKVYDMYYFDQSKDFKVDYDVPQDRSRHILNFDKERIFNGNIIFIQGKDSFSSATMLLTLARDNGIGIIVGEPSGGKPSHYGDILYCYLPNTNTLATVSHKHFVRPNSSLSDLEYIVPDITIDLHHPEKDAVWDWIVTNYGKPKI